MKRTKRKKMICLLFIMSFIYMTAGCQKTNEATLSNVDGPEPIHTTQASDQEKTAMGRYGETETDLTEKLELVTDLQMLSDGSLVILDSYLPFQISKDQGNTWEEWNPDWLKEMRQDQVYFLDMKIGPDGTVGIIYDDSNEDELHPKCALIKPDGTKIEVALSVPEESMYPKNIWISDTGRYFVSTLGTDFYEIKEDGTSKLFLTLDSQPQLVQFQNNQMIIDSPRCDHLMIYDLNTEEFVEDEVLEGFVEEYYPDRQIFTENSYRMYFFFGEEGVLYLAGEKGLHRHVLGGGAVEQIIDGGLSRLSSPKYMVTGMLMLKNNEFLSVFSDGKIVRFTYDPNIPTVPSQNLKIYSLEENASIRQAVSTYQVQNPDVYIEYQIGLEENSSVTREDALKKLNTKIMAGEGPDLLVLDHLPVDSYLEKGLLLDLSEFLEEFNKKEPLFENMIRAFTSEKGIYLVPGQVSLPLVLGRETYVSKMKDLESFSTSLEQMRKEVPGKDLLGICGEKELLKLFAITSSPAFQSEDGRINEDAVKEFLTQVKKIYEIQMDGIEESYVEDYRRLQTDREQDLGEGWKTQIRFYGINEMSYLGGYQEMSIGILTFPYGYAANTSVQKVDGFEDTVLAPFNGQCKNVFVPDTMLGISAASEQVDLAEDFLELFLGKDVQGSLDGFSVNRLAHKELFTPNADYLSEDGIYGYLGSSNGDGREVNLTVYWPTDEQLSVIEEWMEAAETPYIENRIVEEAVFDEGVKFMQGEQDLETTISRIEQKLSIYLAE